MPRGSPGRLFMDHVAYRLHDAIETSLVLLRADMAVGAQGHLDDTRAQHGECLGWRKRFDVGKKSMRSDMRRRGSGVLWDKTNKKSRCSDDRPQWLRLLMAQVEHRAHEGHELLRSVRGFPVEDANRPLAHVFVPDPPDVTGGIEGDVRGERHAGQAKHPLESRDAGGQRDLSPLENPMMPMRVGSIWGCVARSARA
jgi:hypothetical protein